MAETLFGYSIDEDDGTLVVTVRGTLAEGAIRQLRQRVESGETWPVKTLLSPLVPLGRLLSSPVQLRSEAVHAPAWTQVDEDALNQQVDQTLAAFTQQMEEFRVALAELEEEPTKPEPAQTAPAPKGTASAKPASRPKAG
jgi:hypothetical protein